MSKYETYPRFKNTKAKISHGVWQPGMTFVVSLESEKNNLPNLRIIRPCLYLKKHSFTSKKPFMEGVEQ